MKPENKRHPFFHRTLAVIRECAQVTFDPEQSQEAIEQIGHNILLALKGRGDIYINNRPSQLSRNKAFVIPAGTITKICSDSDTPLTVYWRCCMRGLLRTIRTIRFKGRFATCSDIMRAA